MGDWYIFEDYTKIRLYVVEVPPYHLPIFFPMRIFSLESIRHSLNVDQGHFNLSHKGCIFKLEMIVGSFTVNSR